MVVAVAEQESEDIVCRLKGLGEQAWVIGDITTCGNGSECSNWWKGNARRRSCQAGGTGLGKRLNLQAVIDRIEANEINGRIACVVSNRQDAFALKRAEQHGIPAIIHEIGTYASRRAYDADMVDILRDHGVDDAYFASERDRHLEEYREFLRIPSVSALPAHREDMKRAAEWVANALRSAGVPTVEILPTQGHPVVYGAWPAEKPGTPTLLLYAHYDTQPADPFQ